MTLPDSSDAEQLALVHVQAWRETYGDAMPEEFLDGATQKQAQRWTRRLTEPEFEGRVRVARHRDRIVGFALCGPAVDEQGHPAVREEQLFAIYVLAEWHDLGVGQALLDACLGDRSAQLWVAENNQRARLFYERNGFVPDGTGMSRTEPPLLVQIRMVR